MTVFLCSTQPDIFRFLARKIEKKGHFCILFSDYTSYLTALNNSKKLPDLAVLDYTLENHLISKSPYELLYEMKQYMPLIFYNDPCIADGARVSVWKNFIETLENRDFIPKEQFYTPDIEEIEKLLVLINEFVEASEFTPYIKLMQKPRPFPKQLTIDYQAESFLQNDGHLNSASELKEKLNLPENLYVLLQIFYKNSNTILGIQQLQNLYSEQKSKISEKTLLVFISQLRSHIKKSAVKNLNIRKVPDGYIFEVE